MQDRVLGVFFTKGTSALQWEQRGLLDREKSSYEEMLREKRLSKVYWFTYGTEESLKTPIHRGIIIVPKPHSFVFPGGDFLYSLLLPFWQRSYLKKCNILKTNQIDGSWSAVISKIVHKKPLVVRTGYCASKNDWEGKNKIDFFKHRFIEYLAYTFSDAAIVTSKAQEEYITKRYPLKIKRVIPNFVDTSIFRFLNFDKNKEIIFVGRLSPEKNLFALIEAIAQTPYSLDIYGQGPLKSKIEQHIKRLGKEKQIKLCGVVPNNQLPSILNRYKLYVLPSLYEGMPKTLIEAMSCGICCLGTNVSGINEIIQHDKNGWLTKGDRASIKKEVDFLMHNHLIEGRLGKNARKFVEKQFSINQIVKKEVIVYEEIERKGK